MIFKIRAGLQSLTRQYSASQMTASTVVMGMERVSAPSGSILEQYKLFTSQHPTHMVMMQVGDFYEFYGESAERASRLLDIALGKAGSGANRVPFTGFPIRSLPVHLGKLLRQGESVVVCEQYQERHRNSFRRRVARIVTPGTITDSDMLETGKNNFLLAIERDETGVALAWSDISTGQVMIRTVSQGHLLAELRRIHATEILGLPMDGIETKDCDIDLNVVDLFYPESVNFESFSNTEMAALVRLLSYIKHTQVSSLPRLSIPTKTNDQQFMSLPGSVLQALEIIDTESKEGLISRLSICRTGPGQRLFSERFMFPSMDMDEINRRLDSVEYFVTNEDARYQVRHFLDGVPDFARAFQRIRSGKSALLQRDLRSIVSCFNACEQLEGINGFKMDPKLEEFSKLYSNSIDESGERTFKSGFNAELDRMYQQLQTDDNIQKMEERMKLDIQSDQLSIISVRNVYYVEVPRATPINNPDFHLESSTTTKLRYRHKDLESAVLAREVLQRSITTLEQDLLYQLACTIDPQIFDKFANEVAELDVAASSAELAIAHHYCRPRVFSDCRYKVVMGRHPIVEQLRRSTFVRNNLSLAHFSLVTGPNMGGKSTFLKQAALIAIMAQAGMYVPASEAEIGLVDAIFTRVGASDDITTNQSTFMVEMAETSEILRSATPRSLVLMDEVGRGTAWEEGYALAHAIVKYLIDHVKARCLFATHYSELEKLVKERGQSCLKTDAIIGADGSLTPLYSVTEGVAEHSFAVAVARAAGLPHVVLDEAVRKWQEVKTRI